MDQAPKPPGGGQGESTLLSDTGHVRADIALVGRAVRERWAVPKDLQQAVLQRLTAVVNKPTCQIMTKEGPFDSDGAADSNAVKAASVIVAMTKLNQDDDHLTDKNERLDAGKETERIAATSVKRIVLVQSDE